LLASEGAREDFAMANILPSNETTTPDNPISTRVMTMVADTMRAEGLNEVQVLEGLVGAKSTPEIYRAALNRRAQWNSDKEWTAKLAAKDFATVREDKLLSIVLNGDIVSASEAEAHEKRLMGRVGYR
jgi:hypothetical protein